MKQALTIFCMLAGWAIALTAHVYDITATRLSTADGLPTNVVGQVWQDSVGFVWMQTRSGFTRYDGYELRTFATPSAQPPTQQLVTHSATWVANDGQLTRHDRTTGKEQTWQLVPQSIMVYTQNAHFHVADVDHDTEAISTYGAGLFLYNKPTGRLTQISKRDGDGIVGNDYLTNLFVDRTGCLWVVEDFLGVKCLRLGRLDYSRHMLVATPALQDENHVRCLAIVNGQLMAANQTGRLYACNADGSNATQTNDLGIRAYAMIEDTHKNVYIGTRGRGLLKNGKHVDALRSRNIYDLLDQDDGSLWVATLDGGLTRLHSDGRTETVLPDKKVHDVEQAPHGRLWVATEEGLFLIDKRGRTVASTRGYCVSLCTARDGNEVWAGCIGQGLLHAQMKGDSLKVERFTRHNGLPSDNVNAVVTDGQGTVWMGTEEGLAWLHPSTGHVGSQQLTGDRLANVFSENCVLRLPSGNILFGTHAGIVVVSPHQGHDGWTQQGTQPSPPPSITAMLVNGHACDTTSLDYRQNNLTFCFSNFNYADLGSSLYQYRMDGADNDWSEPSGDHTATYRNLPPGRYVFRTRSTNGSGLWSREARMSIEVRQPWWNTWLAWMVYLATGCALLLAILLTSRRMFRLHRQIDVERRVQQFRMDFYERLQRELRQPATVLQGAAENVGIGGTSKTTIQSLRRGSRRMLRLMDMVRQFHSLSDLEVRARAEQEAMNEEADKQFRLLKEQIRTDEDNLREMAPPPLNPQRIAIAANDKDTLAHLRNVLNPYFKVMEHDDGLPTAEVLKDEDASLLLIDMQGQEHESRELTRQLHGQLPVVLLSDSDDDVNQLRSLRAGAADYIVKPFSSKVLVERIGKVMPQHPTTDTGHPNGEQAEQLMLDLRAAKFLDQMQLTLRRHATEADFTVERWAELMHLGRTQFYKKVKELTGTSPVKHLQRARLEEAHRLLADTQLTVEDVMTRVGFSSATHFYEVYKEMFGESPKGGRQYTTAEKT